MKLLFTTNIHPEDKERFTVLNGVDITFKPKNEVTEDDLKNTEVIFGNIPAELVLSAPALKWVQLDSAGANTYAALDKAFTLTNASGAYGTAISEYMLACTLAILKKLPEYGEMQKMHEWENLGSVRTIDTLKVLCIGTGDIGSAYARLMHTLGATVYGVHRTDKPLPEYFSGSYTFQTMSEILPQCDVIAMSLPETSETIHIMNKETFALTKPGSILINVGRGSAIDTTALIHLQKEGHFAGVYLDVFEHEPLPKNDPVRNTKGIYCTPHIAGRFNAETTYDKVIDIMYTNLQHYLANEPLEHIVDRKLGY